MTLLISMKNRPAADLLSQLLPAAQDVAEMRRLCETLLSVSDDYLHFHIFAFLHLVHEVRCVDVCAADKSDRRFGGIICLYQSGGHHGGGSSKGYGKALE